ncbi:MAG TPA: glycosyltransferase [Rhodanobacteraceae bacterium]
MSLRILSVPFPFAPVRADPVGGAEQVAAALDRALVAAGHESIVIACADSQVAGTLVALPRTSADSNDCARAQRHAEVRAAIARVLEAQPVDAIHLHGMDCEAYLPPPGVPTLVTLHLPLAWYADEVLHPQRPLTWLQPVSRHQAHGAPQGVRLLAPIENGVAGNRFAGIARQHEFALALGRICPEKGFHDAIAAARAAGMPLLIAGEVFAWEAHRRYFDDEIAPQLGPNVRFVGALRGARKQRLLAAARCVLIPSRVPETSSLVAMEALAAGTPVVAYRSGALPEIVEHGATGFVVDDVEGMARAITRCECIVAQTCRQAAQRRFPLQRMCDGYLDLYQRLAAQAPERGRATDATPGATRQPPGAARLPSWSRGNKGWRDGARDDFVPGT